MIDFLINLMFSPAFIVKIEDSKATCVRGIADHKFISACSDIAKQNNITKGKITGIHRSQHIELKFCNKIPSDLHQRFRNSYAIS